MMNRYTYDLNFLGTCIEALVLFLEPGYDREREELIGGPQGFKFNPKTPNFNQIWFALKVKFSSSNNLDKNTGR
jgi:hypothetical protein